MSTLPKDPHDDYVEWQRRVYKEAVEKSQALAGHPLTATEVMEQQRRYGTIQIHQQEIPAPRPWDSWALRGGHIEPIMSGVEMSKRIKNQDAEIQALKDQITVILGSTAEFLAWLQAVNPELREQYQLSRQVAQRIGIDDGSK